MNFDLTENTWYQVEDLEDEMTYLLQSKIKSMNGFQEVEILFTQSESEPEEDDDGLLLTAVKFKKKAEESVYIKPISLPVNVQIEVV